MMQRTANENANCFRRSDQPKIGRLVNNGGLAMIFLRPGQFFVCPEFLYRDNGMIFWFFLYCPLPRVLHVTLANWLRFGFD